VSDTETLWREWEAARLRAQPARLPDPATIPPREWLYGARLVCRFVSVLVSPGGVGKSAYALAVAVAIATGRPILDETVHRSVPAWVLNLEDPMDELDRRLAAILMLHRLDPAELRDRLFLHSGRQRRVCMAQLEDGAVIRHPDRAPLIEEARARGIGLIVVDPFVKSHGLDENSNPHMDAAATAWAEVAEATGAAVLLVHHVRKAQGTGLGPDIDTARGGRALIDAARSAFLLSPMTAEEADGLSVPGTERWRHVRLDDGKANLAPRAERARWFRLESVALGNASTDYPAGDQVAALLPWTPQSVWARLSDADCNAALDRIATGPGRGTLYAPHRRGLGAERWAGRVLIDQFGLTEQQAAEVIDTWLRTGLLFEAEYRDEAQRKTRRGVRVVDAKRPAPGAPSDATSGFAWKGRS